MSRDSCLPTVNAAGRGCEFHANCKAVCPKGVPPIEGIGKARKEIKERGKETSK